MNGHISKYEGISGDELCSSPDLENGPTPPGSEPVLHEIEDLGSSGGARPPPSGSNAAMASLLGDESPSTAGRSESQRHNSR